MTNLHRNINEGEDTLSFISENSKKKKKTEWIKPVRKPTETEGRKMFGKALEMMLILCMDNHLYQYGNIVRIQNNWVETDSGNCGLFDDRLGQTTF